MSSLQIRDMPEPLHQLLQQRARRHNRSLSQQALCDLEQASGGNPRERRLAALERLEALAAAGCGRPFQPTPEQLIRVDRDR